MKKNYKNQKLNSLFFKIPLVLIIITLLAGIISYINIKTFAENEIKREINDQLMLVSSSLDWALSPLIEEKNIDSIQRILENIGSFSLIEKICILDKNHEIIASNNLFEIGNTSNKTFAEDIFIKKKLKIVNEDISKNLFEIAVPIRTRKFFSGTQSDTFAVLYMKANVQREIQLFENVKRTLIIEKLGTIILVIITVFLSISFLVLLPIKKIKIGMTELAKGNYIHIVDLKASSEINDFINMFNEMANKINESSIILLKAKEEAEGLNKLKSEFLANMSHEIRTPLNAIIGFSEVLFEEEENKQKREYLNTIVTSSTHLLEIINEILDFSKLERKKIQIVIKPFLLDELIKNSVEMFKINETVDLKFEVKNLSKTHLSSNHLTVNGDSKRISQIIINLLSNSFKFCKYGKIVFTYKYDYRDNYLKFLVYDTGIGIEKDTLKNIFYPFEQIENMYSKKFEGTGLGLSITLSLVNLMKGKIVVKSTYKKYTHFFIKIPLEISEQAISLKENNKEISFLINEKKDFKLLITEDIMDNINLLLVTLKKMNIDIEYVMNGKEAMEKLEKNNYDLLLLDIQMPIMNGYEVINAIRKSNKKYKELYVIALTAFSLENELNNILEAGCNDYLTKPLNRKELKRKIAERISAKEKLKKGKIKN